MIDFLWTGWQGSGHEPTAAGRQRLRVLRGPLLGRPGDAGGRAAGRPDRRLSRRADDAHPGPRQDEGPGRRVRRHVLAADGGVPRARRGQGREGRHERRRAQPARSRGTAARAGRAARDRGARRPRRGRRPAGACGGAGVRRLALRTSAHGQRLPGGVGDRRVPSPRGGRRGHRPRHGRVPGGGAGRGALRVGAGRLGRAGGGDRRRARPGVRGPGHGRQLRVLRRDLQRKGAGFSGRGGPGRRLLCDHQARGDGRRGHRRDRHGTAAVRDRRTPLRRSRRDDALRHDRAGARRARPGADQRCQGRPAAADDQGLPEPSRRPPQRDDLRADGPRHRGQGGTRQKAAGGGVRRCAAGPCGVDADRYRQDRPRHTGGGHGAAEVRRPRP